MTASVHVWPGVASLSLAQLPLAGLDALTLVYRATDGATGFDREPGGSAVLRACAASLVLAHANGTSDLLGADPVVTVRSATRPRAFVFADPHEQLAEQLARLAEYQQAVARTVLPRRYGRPVVMPSAPLLAQLFDESPPVAALQLATTLSAALFVFQFAGEWGLTPTLFAAAGTGTEIVHRIAAAGIAVVHAPTQRDLPMW